MSKIKRFYAPPEHLVLRQKHAWLTALSLLSASMLLSACGADDDEIALPLPNSVECKATQYLDMTTQSCKDKASQSITRFVLPTLKVGDQVVLTATVSSGIPISFTSKTPDVCAVTGTTLTALTAGECQVSANQAGDAKTMAAPEVLVKNLVKSAFLGTLTQTGVTTCATISETGVTCTQAALGELHGLGQDGEVQAGKKMSYTLLNQGGAECVRDHATGLIWEQKTDDGGLRDKDWEYTWYNPDSATNGGSAGYQDHRDYDSIAGTTCGDRLSQCNTASYVAALNAESYCGYSDWRLPSRMELRSLVDYSGVTPDFYINPIFTAQANNLFWSSSPHANQRESVGLLDLNSVRYVDFSSGRSGLTYKFDAIPVRAVRTDYPLR